MNGKRALIGGVAVVPLIALLGFGLTRDPREIPSPLPGRAAPAFALQVFAQGTTAESQGVTLDSARLAAMRGQIVVLNFWASWCLACRDEHEALSTVAANNAGTDVKFFGVLYNDLATNGRKWIDRMGGQSYPSLLDPGTRTAIEYGLYGVPETFFIGRDGKVAYKHVGPVTTALLERKIAELRAAPAAAP
jgi:cytochrome c biogenesis protein CcmG, thiol:disulfide interchange protein DsbE